HPSPEKDGRPLRRFFISRRSTEIIRQAFPVNSESFWRSDFATRSSKGPQGISLDTFKGLCAGIGAIAPVPRLARHRLRRADQASRSNFCCVITGGNQRGRVSDWWVPDGDAVLPDTSVSRFNRLTTGSRAPIEKQN
ncbi:hypothetical protein, partial [Rhizobium alvei]|uniref:hypothetical protein n=1 Tax=Rhizobium alvei TaxID=1132659 RepID=UPI003612C904